MSKKPKLSSSEASLLTESLRAAGISSNDRSRGSSDSSLFVPVASECQTVTLLDLPTEILRKIIVLVLPKQHEESIYPYYSQGMLKYNGVYADGDWSHVNTSENMDLTIFSTNKLIHDLASTLFYNEKKFIFEHPVICKWWIKRLGHEIAKVRCMILIIKSGYDADRGTQDPMNICHEQMWLSTLCVLKEIHQFTDLGVLFLRWGKLKRSTRYTPNQKAAMEYARLLVFSKLQTFRGIPRTTIISKSRDSLFNDTDLARMSMLMGQRRIKEKLVEQKSLWEIHRNMCQARLQETGRIEKIELHNNPVRNGNFN